MASPARRLWSPTISDNRAVGSLMKASPSQGCAAMYFIAALTDLPPEATKGVLIDAQPSRRPGWLRRTPWHSWGERGRGSRRYHDEPSITNVRGGQPHRTAAGSVCGSA